MRIISFCIALGALFVACEKYEPLLERIEDDFSLQILDSTGAVLDGKFTVRLVMTNSKNVKEGLRVNFISNKGAFLVNDVSYENNTAQTQLKLDQESGLYVIKGQLKDGDAVKIEKIITTSFKPALPEHIGMEFDRTRYSLSNPTIIKTWLLRSTGKVTLGTQASFKAFQIRAISDTVLVGRFEGLFNNLSDPEGKLKDIKLYTDTPGIDTNRVIYVQANCFNVKGNIVGKTLQISYK